MTAETATDENTTLLVQAYVNFVRTGCAVKAHLNKIENGENTTNAEFMIHHNALEAAENALKESLEAFPDMNAAEICAEIKPALQAAKIETEREVEGITTDPHAASTIEFLTEAHFLKTLKNLRIKSAPEVSKKRATAILDAYNSFIMDEELSQEGNILSDCTGKGPHQPTRRKLSKAGQQLAGLCRGLSADNAYDVILAADTKGAFCEERRADFVDALTDVRKLDPVSCRTGERVK